MKQVKIWYYLIPFLFYIFIQVLFDGIGFSEYVYIVKILVVGFFMLLFWKHYQLDFKKTKWELAFLSGLIIILIWIALGFILPVKSEFNPTASDIIIRIFGSILIAPLIEELFTRHFLYRYLINEKFYSIKPKFEFIPFILTVGFFGFFHSAWIAGMIVGLILNFLYIKTKNIEDCIIAHSVANLLLAIFIILFQQWSFW